MIMRALAVVVALACACRSETPRPSPSLPDDPWGYFIDEAEIARCSSVALLFSFVVAGLIALAMVVAFALVTGRILKLATDANMFTGITLALTYFLVINLLLSMATRGGA